VETFRYDLVNLGRELLAQWSTPLSIAFSLATLATPLNTTLLNSTGNAYIQLLLDIDALVGTEEAFLLGPWLEV
jgi:alpha-N-acetylglucosaminidase